MERYRLLVEVSGDVIFALTPDGRLTFANARVRDVLGYEPAMLIGRRLSALAVAATPAIQRRIRRLARRGAGAASFTMVARAVDGTTRRLDIRLVPLVIDGRVVALHGIARAVTAQTTRAAADRHAERLRALGAVAAGVAHDLNNLLSIVLARSELLLHQPHLPDHVRTELETIVQAAQDAATRVRRLRTVARGEPRPALGPVDLRALVAEALDMTRSAWQDIPRREGYRIDVVRALRDVPAVRGDAVELREALVNLIVNACDALPQGGTLRLRTGARGQRVYVAVEHRGAGMPPEMRRGSVEPPVTTKARPGAGLGLAASQAIAERHGGRLIVRTSPGRGTTVTLELPAMRPARPAASEPPVPRPQRILVVEDSPQVRATLVRMLEADGHEVVAIEGDAAVLAVLSERRFDLLITDLGMPGMSGYEILAAVRQRWPSLPVVVMTGWREQVDAERLAAAGASVVLHKPLRQRSVRRAVSEALAQARPAAPAGGRVLVVDRDARLARLLAQLLASAGYTTAEATDASEALDRLAAAAAAGAPFDILLSDVALAEMDGWTLAATARERQPGLVVGVLSSAPIPEAEAVRRGVDIIVAKPYRLDEVLAALARAQTRRAKE
jgi:PAS domain S-box-containing protein